MINEIITTYGMTEGKTKSTPLNAAVPLMTDGGTTLDTSEFHYSGLVGSLLYLSTCTRPDIAQAVGVLAKYVLGSSGGVSLTPGSDLVLKPGQNKLVAAVGVSPPAFTGNLTTGVASCAPNCPTPTASLQACGTGCKAAAR